jgi:hypothetical protein
LRHPNPKENQMPHKEFLKKFSALLKGVSDSATRDLLEKLQITLAHSLEENAVLREVLRDTYHCKSPRLTSEQKKRSSRIWDLTMNAGLLA